MRTIKAPDFHSMESIHSIHSIQGSRIKLIRSIDRLFGYVGRVRSVSVSAPTGCLRGLPPATSSVSVHNRPAIAQQELGPSGNQCGAVKFLAREADGGSSRLLAPSSRAPQLAPPERVLDACSSTSIEAVANDQQRPLRRCWRSARGGFVTTSTARALGALA